MKKGWTTTKLIATGSLGVLHLVVNLLGGGIVAVSGIPLTSGLINVFTGGFLFSFTCLLIKIFGAATFMKSVYTILALPLPVLGMPGFLPKLFIGPFIGIRKGSGYIWFSISIAGSFYRGSHCGLFGLDRI